MTDEQRRAHAVSQLRAARELYSETGNSAYLAVIDSHLKTITEVDERRRLAEARRLALLELRRQSAVEEETKAEIVPLIPPSPDESIPSLLKSQATDPKEFLKLLSEMAEGAEPK